MVNSSRAKRHLKRTDKRLAPLLIHVEELRNVPSVNPFVDLVEAIINQQLSDKAGRTIFRRFRLHFLNGKITPRKVLGTSDRKIRSLGVSWSKVTYLKSLAGAIVKKQLVLNTLAVKSDEEVILELMKIKGIGRWTAEMFLMFSLGREDIFSYGDLGLRRGIQKLYGFKKEPTIRQMEKIVMKWKPYRTYGARILWKYLDLT